MKIFRLLRYSLIYPTLIISAVGGLLILLAVISYSGGSKFFEKGCFPFSSDLDPINITQKDPKKLKFIVLGDTAVYRESLLINKEAIAKSAIEYCRSNGCDFMLLMGDNISNEGVQTPFDPIWAKYHEKFFDDFKAPMIAVIGNHDIKSNIYSMMSYGMLSDTWKMPNSEFTFATNVADFTTINSNCDLLAYWKLRDQEPSDKWSFLLAHHPIHSSGQHKSAPIYIRAYWNWLIEEKFNFHLSGHNHLLEHINFKDDETEYIISGAGSDLYDPKQQGKELGEIPDEVRYRFLGNGFVYFEVSADSARVKYINKKGKKLYEFTKNKG